VMKLILVRHGETVWNLEQRVQGLSDIELSKRGKEQAQILGRCLKDEAIERIVSSPLKRAYQTAQAIGRFHEVDIEIDEDLRELDQGIFDGLTFREMRKRYASFLSKWAVNPGPLVIPGGESLVDLQQRAWPAIERIIAISKNTLVVSHNFTIAVILCNLQSLRLASLRDVTVDVASRTYISVDGLHRTVFLFNDTSHLE
jgi:broad specificity phosphatase PhoE